MLWPPHGRGAWPGGRLPRVGYAIAGCCRLLHNVAGERRGSLPMPRTILQVSRLMCALMCSAAAVAFAEAKSLTLTGQAGYLGEWELSADVAETPAGGKREYHGVLHEAYGIVHAGWPGAEDRRNPDSPVSLRLPRHGDAHVRWHRMLVQRPEGRCLQRRHDLPRQTRRSPAALAEVGRLPPGSGASELSAPDARVVSGRRRQPSSGSSVPGLPAAWCRPRA